LDNFADQKFVTRVYLTSQTTESPEPDLLLLFLQILFSIATIGCYIYSVYTFFTLDGPWWQAYALSAVALPFTILPLSVVPTVTDAFITICAVAPPGNTGNNGDLTRMPLLGSENV
jgi:hypothetical protein